MGTSIPRLLLGTRGRVSGSSSSVKEPGRLRLPKDRIPGLPNQLPTELLRKALRGLTITRSLYRDLWQSLIIAALLEAIDGLIAALFSKQDLREKDDQGDPRRVDAGSPLMTDIMAGGLDHGPGEKFEERQPMFLGELIAERLELEANGSVWTFPTIASRRPGPAATPPGPGLLGRVAISFAAACAWFAATPPGSGLPGGRGDREARRGS
jgi:hypothetical protein